MPRCKIQHTVKKKVPIGDMNSWVTLRHRSLSAGNIGDAEAQEVYTTLYETWAQVITYASGEKYFDGVQLKERPTHSFRIRYISSITSELVISWNGNNYTILDIQNPEERNEYLFLNAKELGDQDLEANQ